MTDDERKMFNELLNDDEFRRYRRAEYVKKMLNELLNDDEFRRYRRAEYVKMGLCFVLLIACFLGMALWPW